jgi:hypothetical protein
MIIGLSGYAGAGKDEAAKVLIGLGYTRIAFADVLREMAVAIDPYIYEVLPGENDIHMFRRLSDVIENYGWDEAKNMFPDVRRLLQRLGTEAGRNILGENIWVDTAFGRAKGGRICVTDVRFLNELEGIRSRGGKVLRIERPGVGPRNDHPSETSLVDATFDAVIQNDGSIEQLHARVLEFANEAGML